MIRVLIADRSAQDRQHVMAMLNCDSEIAVVGEASSSADVLKLTHSLRPDIIAMGMDIPKRGAFETTKDIMVEVPTPVVIISDETDALQIDLSILALRAGALAVIPKLSTVKVQDDDAAAKRFVSAIKAMSQVKVVRHWRARPVPPPLPQNTEAPTQNTARIVAIAASTGGPAALQQILSNLPADFRVPILVVQHIGVGFVGGLATWLNGVSALRVKVAVDGEKMLPRTVYVAPDDRHLGVLDRSSLLLSNAEAIEGFRPSATFLFQSVAKSFGSSAVNLILTGMGRDGVAGLKVAQKSGSRIIAQDRATSVVFGMPGEAISAGLAGSILPLSSMAEELTAIVDTAGSCG